MPMDGVTLGFIARELSALLRGPRGQGTQPERDEIILTIRNGGKTTCFCCLPAPTARGRT